ncbi:MAG: hypothetical protein ACI4MZ_00610 [Christensenellales bacterium]
MIGISNEKIKRFAQCGKAKNFVFFGVTKTALFKCRKAENAFANVLQIDIYTFLCNNIFVSENEKRPNRPERRIT